MTKTTKKNAELGSIFQRSTHVCMTAAQSKADTACKSRRAESHALLEMPNCSKACARRWLQSRASNPKIKATHSNIYSAITVPQVQSIAQFWIFFRNHTTYIKPLRLISSAAALYK